jgi:hypothetical protein
VCVEIRNHERDAIQRLVMNARAMVSVLADHDDGYVRKLLAWANIVEEFLDRVEP